MFNLEQTIAEWRRKMRAAGIVAPELLDELESHLRDEVERGIRSGPDASRAFADAVAQMGTNHALKIEFEKLNPSKLMKTLIIFGAGIVGILVGTGFILPALAHLKMLAAASTGDTPQLGEAAFGLIVGTFLATIGLCAAFQAVVFGKKRKFSRNAT